MSGLRSADMDGRESSTIFTTEERRTVCPKIARMKKRFLIAFAVFVSGVAGSQTLHAQDLVITNVRVIVGNGTVVNQASIAVRGGRIASVSAGAPGGSSGQTIDGRGLTAMPGFIDAHRHVNTGPNEKAQMQALLDAGYTTILSGGGPAEGNITLRDHIEKGVIKGPRIIPSGRLDLANSTPDAIRAEVRRLAGLGVKFIGEQALTPKPGPTAKELENLKAAVDES